MVNILNKFLNSLSKSFDGKDHLREINQCEVCNEPSFTHICLYCKTQQDYNKQYEKDHKKF
jgi:hypothetical protein